MGQGNFGAGLFRLKFQGLGTECEVQFRAPSVEVAKGYRKGVMDWMREFEATWSRFKEGSLLCRINKLAGKEAVELSEEQEEVLRLCAYTYETSGGLLDATSLPLTHLWERAGKVGEVPADWEVEEARKLMAWPEVEWGEGRVFLPESGMGLEIGGFGKEYAVDQLIHLARIHGVSDVLVDLGRDVGVLGRPPDGEYWVLGVEDAQNENEALYRLALSGRALATSGNGRRFREIGGKKFGHILDGRTGWPAENDILTVSCVAGDCLSAGLLATTCCVIGAEEGLKRVDDFFEIDAIVQRKDGVGFSVNIHRYVLGS